MPRSREERLHLHALHKAAATALEASLKNDAIDEYERQGSAATWRFGEDQDDLVVTSIAHAHAEAVDTEAMLDFLEQWTEMTYRREVREVNPDALKGWLATLAPVVEVPDGGVSGKLYRSPTKQELKAPGARFTVADDHGRIVPGVEWVAGGRLESVSIRLSGPRKRQAGVLAKQYADGDLSWENLERLDDMMDASR
jgi:hypothetical protein